MLLKFSALEHEGKQVGQLEKSGSQLVDSDCMTRGSPAKLHRECKDGSCVIQLYNA